MPFKRLNVQIRSADILYYLHLPGTNGTAFFALLATRFSPTAVRSLPEWPLRPDELTYQPEDFVGVRLVRGRFDYNFFHHLPRTPVYLTWLCEPITRVVTLYQQLTTQPTHPLHHQLGQLSLAQFVEHPLFALEGSNAMTRRLAASAFPEKQTVPDAVLLEMAQVNLDEMAYFGLAEEARLSLSLLAYTFGWPVLKPTAPPDLPATCLDDIPAETLAQIRGRNQLDIALYQFARQVWQHRLHQMVEELLLPPAPPVPPQDWLLPLRQWRWRWLPEGTRRGRVYHRLTALIKPKP